MSEIMPMESRHKIFCTYQFPPPRPTFKTYFPALDSLDNKIVWIGTCKTYFEKNKMS